MSQGKSLTMVAFPFPSSKSCCLILENEYHSLVIVLGLRLSITVTRSVSPMGRKLMFTLLAF